MQCQVKICLNFFCSLFYSLFISLLYSKFEFEFRNENVIFHERITRFDFFFCHNILIIFFAHSNSICVQRIRYSHSVFGFACIDIELLKWSMSQWITAIDRFALVRKIQIIPENNCIIRNAKCSEPILLLCCESRYCHWSHWLATREEKKHDNKKKTKSKKVFYWKYSLLANIILLSTNWNQNNVIVKWFCPTFFFVYRIQCTLNIQRTPHTPHTMVYSTNWAVFFPSAFCFVL